MSAHVSRAPTPELQANRSDDSTENLIPSDSTLRRAGAFHGRLAPRTSATKSMTAPATTTHLAQAEASTSRAEAAHSVRVPAPERLTKVAQRIEMGKPKYLEECAKKILLIAESSDKHKYAGGSDYVKLILKDSIRSGIMAENVSALHHAVSNDWQGLDDQYIGSALKEAAKRFQENIQLLGAIQHRGGISSDLSDQINRYTQERGSINAAQISRDLKATMTGSADHWHVYADRLGSKIVEAQIQEARQRAARGHDADSTV